MHKTSKKNQQGAIGLFGVLTLMMAVLFVAVAVDSGRMWMEKRKLQNIADMAAIAAGGQVGGCVQNNSDVYRMAAQGAAMANGYQGSLLAPPNVVELGGYSTDEGGVRTFVANGERRAVHVLATQEVPSSLIAGGIFNQRVVLQAEAVAAVRAPVAAFRAGSMVADADLLNNLLSGILGSNIRLVSYDGLLNTNIKLLDLVKVNSNVGSVSELLNMNLSLGQFFTLLQTAVDQNGNPSEPGLGAVVENLGYLATGTVKSLHLRLADVLKISNPDANAVASTQVNLLNLITTAAFVANGSNAIHVPLGISLLGLANIETSIRVIEPPQLAIGPPAVNGVACTVARTAQVRVETNIFPSDVLSVLASVDLKLSLEVAQGRAELMEVRTQGNRTNVVINPYSGLINLRLTSTSDSSKPAEIRALAGIISTNVGLRDNPAQSSPSNNAIIFDVNHPVADHLSQSANSSAGTKSLAEYTKSSQLVIEDVCLIGLCLDFVIKPIINTVITPVINQLVVPLLTTVTANVLDPLLRMLGIDVAGVTVILDDVGLGNAQVLLR
ncbi:TadG family pilus assembly protein [Methylobacillus sp. Pita2]|uniref:TadG family pilus assembly protein n=1 Tax=Methylobacillus sp. Pita2 TaxID=3383245 RepID=UPI0038B4E322